ncbi:hypothetical protein RV06_GL000583 [Enterococcus haemoperoxidus]|nr:hypothetical protein RV06_GL000583 [Enterococcus haemoperoxidus]
MDVAFEPKLVDGNYQVTLKIDLDDRKLLSLIESRKAKITVITESRKTYYFDKYDVDDINTSFQIDIPYKDVDNMTYLTAYIVISVEQYSYSNPSFNEDYSNQIFDLKVGSILGISNTITIETIQDPVEVASIFTIQANSEKDDLDFSVDIDSEDKKIVINLSKDNKKLFSALYSVDKQTIYGLLLVPVLTDVLMQVIADYDQYREKNWFHSLNISLKEQNIDIKEYSSNDVEIQEMIEDSRTFAWKLMKTNLATSFDAILALQNDLEEVGEKYV